MKGHPFTKTLKAKGQFLYCASCGLVALSNKATQKAIPKPEYNPEDVAFAKAIVTGNQDDVIPNKRAKV